jgi:TonB family protein
MEPAGFSMTGSWTEWEGRVIGGFPLLKFLGSSESSALFLTNRGGEQAVIKLLPAAGEAARAQLARWERASQLSHPHLARIFEQGSAESPDGPLVFVVMEYAEEVLSQVGRPLTSGEALDALAPALNALAYLHGKGFAHGRLRPSNFLAIKDRLKLSGDAPLRVAERHGHAAMPQPYDAPELEQAGVSPAGDVWSLGITLVETLTQKLPDWDASGPRLPEELPDSFRQVARKCLRQNPGERIPVTEIAQWLQDGGKPGPRETKRRYLFPTIAGAGLIVAAVIGIPYFTRSEPPAPAPASVPTPVAATPAPSKSSAPEVRPPAAKPQPKAPAPVVEKSAAPTPVATQPAGEPPPPGVLQQMLPEVPAKSRNTIHGKVPITVRVQVDSSGSVSEATVESGKSSGYFASMSLKAARQWKFAAGEPREWTLRFEYVRNAEHPVSVQATPSP